MKDNVKMILENGTDYMTANLTGTSKTLTFNGIAGNSNLAQLTLNVRLEMVPEKLENLIRKIIIKEIIGASINTFKQNGK